MWLVWVDTMLVGLRVESCVHRMGLRVKWLYPGVMLGNQSYRAEANLGCPDPNQQESCYLNGQGQ